MKNEICAAIGIVGGAIASLLGGWDTALQTLIIFMAIDYITGLVRVVIQNFSKTIVVQFVFKVIG